MSVVRAERLPRDLPGGWEYHDDFRAEPLQSNQVWRKMGPVDALKIVRVMMPGHAEYDGGANGVSVRPTVIGSGGRVTWSSKTWFWPGDERKIHARLQEHGYTFAKYKVGLWGLQAPKFC